MARRALGPAMLAVVSAVDRAHRGDDVQVACSGGADSLALAAAVAVLARRHGFAARAVVIDHGLQDGSAKRSADVVDILARLDLPGRVVRVVVPATGDGPEASARTARYQALTADLHGTERCYLGHTLDDQAESVLLGLARGSGLRSLAGMAPERDRFVRPLLGLRRAQTRQACVEAGLSWWDDPHNDERRFTRVRVRNRVLPLLEDEVGPGVAEALARTAELARLDADALDQLAAPHAAPDRLDVAVLSALPAGLRGRVLLQWLRRRGADGVGLAGVRAVEVLIDRWRGQQWIDLPGLRVRRVDGELVADPSPDRSS